MPNKDIYEVEYQLTDRDPRQSMLHHDESIELIQTWSKGGYFVLKGNVIPITPGELFIINAMELHYSNPLDIETYNRSKIIISRDLFDEICSVCKLEHFAKQYVYNDEGGSFFAWEYDFQAVDSYFKAAKEYFSADNENTRAGVIGSVLEILLSACRYTSKLKNVDEAEENMPSLIQRMTKYINSYSNHWEDFSLKGMAKGLYISESYASHLFKKLTNKSISQYVMELRIAEAKKFLINTRLKVYEISEILKFSDSTTFCKIFKQHTGSSPKAYRDSFQNRDRLTLADTAKHYDEKSE